MRCRYCILIVLTVFVLEGAFAQGWEWQNPLPSGFDYKSVVMFESREWLISTNNAILLRTSDSGITWSFERNQGDRYSYSKLKFIKGKLWGIAIDGTKNNLCVSTDRGKSFHLLRSPAGDTTNIYDYDAFSGDSLVLLSLGRQSGYVSTTTDAGATWNTQPCPFDAQIANAESNGLAFIDIAHGIISGPTQGHGSVYSTTDAGSTWTRSEPSAVNASIHPLIFTDDSSVWGYTNRMGAQFLLRSSDRGMHWTIMPKIASFMPTRMEKIDANTYCMISESVGEQIVLTKNRGESWSYVHNNGYAGTGGFAAVDFLDSLNGLVVGMEGRILSTSDGGFTWSKVHRGWLGIWSDLYFADDKNGFVIGADGEESWNIVAYITRDGGSHWNLKTLPIAYENGSSLSFSDRENVFVGGSFLFRPKEENLLLKTTDMGSTWISVYSWPGKDSSLFGFHKLCFIDAFNGWSIARLVKNGQGFGLLRTSDGGTSWIDQSSNLGLAQTHTIEEIQFTNLQNGYLLITESIPIISSRTLVIRTVNGGITWDTLRTAAQIVDSLGRTSGRAITQLTSKGEQTIWFLTTSSNSGDRDTLFHSKDNGQSWNKYPLPFNSGGGRITFADSLRCWIVFGLKKMWISSNAGRDWEMRENFVQYGDNQKVFFINKDEGWSISSYGSILHTSTGGLNSLPQFTQAPSFSLSQNYPNPTSSLTTIPFEITSEVASRNYNHGIKLVVYDLLGREVATIARDQLEVGKNQISFDASRLQAGVYCYRLMVGEQAMTRKMVVVR